MNLNLKMTFFLYYFMGHLAFSRGIPPNHKMVGFFKQCCITLISLSTKFCNNLGRIAVVFKGNTMQLKNLYCQRQPNQYL